MSAGGVVYRVGADGRLEVAICGRAYPPLWALPKGTPDAGETERETALREVREETGLEVAAEGFIDSIRYTFVRAFDGARCRKVVHFYLMRATGGDFSLHDHEFDAVKWVSVEDACRYLTHQSEADLVRKAADMAARADAGSGMDPSSAGGRLAAIAGGRQG